MEMFANCLQTFPATYFVTSGKALCYLSTEFGESQTFLNLRNV